MLCSGKEYLIIDLYRGFSLMGLNLGLLSIFDLIAFLLRR
jgi:hypothetical protein